MDYSENIYLIRFDVVDDSIRSFNDFANLIQLIFAHFLSGKREHGDLFGTPRDAVYHPSGVFSGIVRYVPVDGVEMSFGRLGPVDSHSARPYFSRISRTSLVRPALLSPRPASIAWRT